MDSKTLRKVQLAQLEIAKEIKRVCDENDIKYFMCGGTLIGAVRHNGFIPWDDDMDFAMLRSEYDRFQNIVKEKLDKQYFFQTLETDSNYGMAFGKLRKLGTVYIENASQKSAAHNELYVDIFPFDNLPGLKATRKKQKKLVMFYRKLMLCYAKVKPWLRYPFGYNRFIRWCGYLPFRILASVLPRNNAIKKYNHIMKIANNDNSCQNVYSQGILTYENSQFKKSVFENLIELPFEDTTFKAPKDYDSYLRFLYGDYMVPPPENQRENRHQIIEVKI